MSAVRVIFHTYESLPALWFRWENSWLAWVAGLVWLLPIGFLSMGYWPFFLLPSIAITAWAWFAVQFTCPVCRGNWKP